MKILRSLAVLTSIFIASCSSGSTSTVQADTTTTEIATTTTSAIVTGSTLASSETAIDPSTTAVKSVQSSFVAEVWADNWFSLYINGKLVGQDSVPITTEKSFNSERITFTASYPFTIAMVTKDFKQNDTGLEYIGTDRQQMGDGGFVAQFTDTSTGKVVAFTNSSWRGLVIHQAPLNVSCEKSKTPDTECTPRISAEPTGWTQTSFNDSSWSTASTYSKEQVGVKDGYNDISWSSNAQLIWTSDLKIDNTILWRYTVAA
ncbi:MAG: PEBP family protein [Actinomycetota bacterium]